MLFSNAEEFFSIAKDAWENAVSKGFWENGPRIEEAFDLIKGELDELEKASNTKSKAIPEFTEQEEEAADAVIISLGFLYGSGESGRLVGIRHIQAYYPYLIIKLNALNILLYIKYLRKEEGRSGASYWWFIFLHKIANMIGEDRLEAAIKAKMAYNKTRPCLHGKSPVNEDVFKRAVAEARDQVYPERPPFSKIHPDAQEEFFKLFRVFLDKIESAKVQNFNNLPSSL